MTLWTIQTIACYEKLLKDKIIYGSRQYVSLPDFLYGYRWMAKQMDRRIGKRPFPECFPIWAWYQWHNARQSKPNLHYSGHLPSGTKAVSLEIHKGENDLLLSDFDLWHYPLSYHGYIGSNEEDAVTFEKFLAYKGLDRKELAQLPKSIRLRIIKSWDKVLDMEFNDSYFTASKEKKSVQATFWSLAMDEIVKAEEFTAR